MDLRLAPWLSCRLGGGGIRFSTLSNRGSAEPAAVGLSVAGRPRPCWVRPCWVYLCRVYLCRACPTARAMAFRTPDRISVAVRLERPFVARGSEPARPRAARGTSCREPGSAGSPERSSRRGPERRRSTGPVRRSPHRSRSAPERTRLAARNSCSSPGCASRRLEALARSPGPPPSCRSGRGPARLSLRRPCGRWSPEPGEPFPRSPCGKPGRGLRA